VPARVIRIISDVHYRDRAGLQHLEALAPLFEGISHMVLNGDTLEARHPNSTGLIAEVRGFFDRAPAPVTFVAGNHDPEISNHAELRFAGGLVWATHGDIFWDSAAPWSRYARVMARLISEERGRRKITTETGSLVDLLSAHQAAHVRNGAPHDPLLRNRRARLRQLARTLLPPTQIIRMLQAWREGPARARTWAQRHRPDARFVLFGHIHYPGVWKPPSGGVTVINTGSFEPPFGGLCVDLSTTSLAVRTVIREGEEYRPGPIRCEFPLAN